MSASTPPTSATATAMNGTSTAYQRSRLGEQAQPSSRFRVGDQPGQAPLPRLFALRAHDVVGEGPLVPGSLRLEEGPGLLVGSELLLMGATELRVASLVCVDARPLRVGLREGGQPGRGHPSELLQGGDALDVDVAPDALRLPWREPDAVADLVDAVAHAVDPPEAERLVHRLRPRDAGPARGALVKADPQLGLLRVVPLQPATEIRGRAEEPRLRCGRHRK